MKQETEKTLARALSIGTAFIAVFVLTGAITDPVNVTKFLALGGVATASFFILASGGFSKLLGDRWLLGLSVIFIIGSVNVISQSKAPLQQNLYGVYGRNTGFLTYLFLIFIIISSSALRKTKSFHLIIWGLISAGLINNIYCLYVILFGDFIGWNNPYGNILGTFGNPNFIGAFLGFFTSALVAYAMTKGVTTKYRVLSGLIFLVSSFEIIKSHAIQGRVVLAGGLAIVGFYWIRSRFSNWLVTSFYSLMVVALGAISVLGALQIGPLTKYIYKTSVSLRGEYWQAGWNMGTSHPFTGVGFDTYGDWYRRARDTQALILPGPNTVTNASHNVPMDVFAFGGWPLLIPYLGFLLLVLVAIVRYSINNKAYDGIFVTLTTAWIGYQIQSFISINQIGLAVWGWLLGGAILGYTQIKREPESENQAQSKASRKVNSQTNNQIFSPQLIGALGAALGLIISCPPINVDSKFQVAISQSDVTKVEAALTPSYLTPPDSYRYANAASIFEGSKLYDVSYKYALQAVKYNPDNFDSWKMLYLVSKSSASDKERALDNIKRLDPNNKNPLG